MHKADITQVGTRFEVLPNPKGTYTGQRGTVIEGLHFDERGSFGISILLDSIRFPSEKNPSRHHGWMVEATKLQYLRPLDDEEPAEGVKKESAHAQG